MSWRVTFRAGGSPRLVHEGSFDELGSSWGRLGQWIAAAGLTPGEDMWEVYVTEPSPDMDPADLRTELNWTIPTDHRHCHTPSLGW